MTEPSTLLRYDHWHGPRPLGTLWTFTRDTMTLTCTVATHRLGWALRASVGPKLMRSQVCKSETEVFDVSKAWETEKLKDVCPREPRHARRTSIDMATESQEAINQREYDRMENWRWGVYSSKLDARL